MNALALTAVAAFLGAGLYLGHCLMVALQAGGLG